MAVALGIGVAVGSGVTVGVGIGVAVGSGVTVGVGTGVAVGSGVTVGVGTGVAVGSGVAVGVGTVVAVGANVVASVGEGLFAGCEHAAPIVLTMQIINAGRIRPDKKYLCIFIRVISVSLVWIVLFYLILEGNTIRYRVRIFRVIGKF